MTAGFNNSFFLIHIIVLIPLLGALLTFLSSRFRALNLFSILLTPSLLLLTVVSLISQYINAHGAHLNLRIHQQAKMDLFFLLPKFPIAISYDPLSLSFALLASVLWLPNTIYSIGYMSHNREQNQQRFFILLSLSMACVMGIAFSGNLLTLFIAYELLSLCTYPLVTHSGTKTALHGGRLYLAQLMTSSVTLFFPAILLTYKVTRNITFCTEGVFSHLAAQELGLLFFGLLALFVYGSAKSALFPLHSWLPSAMVAPTPVSAFLHAVAVVKSGVFVILKVIVYTFGVPLLQSMDILARDSLIPYSLLLLACFTILYASIQALRQSSLKKILAFSTVGQLSYIIATAFLLTEQAIRAASYHMIAHGCAKITLFFAVGTIYTTTRKTSIQEIQGIGKSMPITMACFLISSFSVIGIPPTAGAVSKFALLSTASKGLSFVLLFTLLCSSIASAVYLLRIFYTACFMPCGHAVTPSKFLREAPPSMLLAMMMTTSLTIMMYFFPQTFFFRYGR